jgi:hypothetical protein
MFCLCFNMTSSQPLRLHVGLGLEKHGNPWVPTDQGPRGPCQMDLICQKPHQPASEPRDLIHKTGDLGRLGRPHPDPGRPVGLVARASPLCHGVTVASSSVYRGIHPIITKYDLSNM